MVRSVPVVFFRLDSGRELVRNSLKDLGRENRKAIGVEVIVMAKKNIGSDFHDFLDEDGLLAEATAVAVKRYIAFELAKKMSEKNLSKSEMARRMKTSRSALDRLLDPGNSSVTLQTLQSAAQALGGRLKVELDFQNNAT